MGKIGQPILPIRLFTEAGLSLAPAPPTNPPALLPTHLLGLILFSVVLFSLHADKSGVKGLRACFVFYFTQGRSFLGISPCHLQ
jgi:hypothetical protein